MDSTLRKTILLVEDETLIAITQRMTLEQAGYAVVHANSGEKAVEIALSNDAVALVLMDIDLGRGMRGTEAAELILRQRDLPLAFLSSHTEPEVVDMTEGITSYGYIVKNSGDTVLLASIRMAFKLHEAHAELLKRKEHLDTALAREEHVNELLSEKTDELERYFSTSLDMLCIANTNGEFVRLNPEWEKVLGFSVDELQGRQFLEFVHPDDRDSTVRTLARLADHEDVLNFENRYRCKDGSYRWIEWRSRPVEAAIYAAARDITDQKRTQQDLLQTSTYYQMLIEKAPDGVALLNREGMLFFASPAAKRIFGYDESDDQPIDPDELTHPDDLARVHETIGIVVRDPSQVPLIEYRFRHRQGSWRWVESTFSNQFSEPSIAAIIINFRDITDRKEAAIALNSMERRFHLIMQSMQDIVFTLDSSGRHTGVYGPWVERNGLTPEFFLGKTHEEILGPEASKTHQAATERALCGDFTVYEWSAPSPDGIRHFETSLAPIAEPDGSVSGVIGIGRDITERKKTELALQEQTTLQRLLMTLSAELIDVPLDSVDERIDWMLGELGRFNGFDRVFLFRNDFDRGITTNTHEWCAPGITSEIGNLHAVPLAEMSRIMEKHANGEAFVVPRVSDLPKGDRVRALLDAQGIKSTLLFPLLMDGMNTGFIGFDAVREERTVSDSLIELLRFAAQLLTNIETRRASEQRQRDAEYAIRENEERFRGLLDGIHGVPVQGFGDDGIINYWNLASEELYGHRAEDAIGRNILELLIPSELQPAVTERIRRMVESGEPAPATEEWLVRNDGTRVLVRTAHAIVQLPGKDVELFSIDQDVTEQRRIEEDVRKLAREKELMLKEVQHRIKNTLHTMGSLLSLHARTIKNPEAVAALEDAQSRFGSMEVLYDQLYRADDHSSGLVRQYIVQLIERVTDLFPFGNTVELEIEIEDFSLHAKRLSPVGIIVNELVTNAMKYAFHGHTGPRLRVDGRRCGDRYTLVVSDNGPGLPRSFDRSASSSFGLSMVDALTEQLRGTIRFENDNGTRVRLDFPIS